MDLSYLVLNGLLSFGIELRLELLSEGQRFFIRANWICGIQSVQKVEALLKITIELGFISGQLTKREDLTECVTKVNCKG